MSNFSIIIHQYNKPAELCLYIKKCASWPKYILEEIEFVMVDDCSDTVLEIPDEARHLNISFFSVQDSIDWNMPGCKNLAAMYSNSRYLIFVDIDHQVTLNNIEKLLELHPTLKADTMYRLTRQSDGLILKQSPGLFLVSKSGYFKAGMQDEDFSGSYGFDDKFFGKCWSANVGPIMVLDEIVLETFDSRTVGLSRDTHRNSCLYNEKISHPKIISSKSKIRFNYKLDEAFKILRG